MCYRGLGPCHWTLASESYRFNSGPSPWTLVLCPPGLGSGPHYWPGQALLHALWQSGLQEEKESMNRSVCQDNK